MKLSVVEIRELAAAIVAGYPEGIGGAAIGRQIARAHPEMATGDGNPNGTIRGAVWKLDSDFPDRIVKIDGKFAPKASDVTADEETLVVLAYQEAQARIRHRCIDASDSVKVAARAVVPALRRIAATINKARSESGAAEQCGHIGIDGVARLRLETYLRIRDKALDAADYPLDQLLSRTGGERLTT